MGHYCMDLQNVIGHSHPLLQKPLVQLKCGRVNFERIDGGSKLRLTADPRKGELKLVKDGQASHKCSASILFRYRYVNLPLIALALCVV